MKYLFKKTLLPLVKFDKLHYNLRGNYFVKLNSFDISPTYMGWQFLPGDR